MRLRHPDYSTPIQLNNCTMTHSSESPTRWWLALNGRPDGPRSTAYVTAGVQTGQLSMTTPVCPEGGSEWRPLGTWPVLATAVQATAAPPPPPLPPTIAGAATGGSFGLASDRLLTNPSLPPMANWICVYTILVLPLCWMFGLISSLGDDNPFLDGSWYYWAFALEECAAQVIALGLTIFLAIAGVRLRDLRPSGEHYLRLGLGLSLLWVLLRLAIWTAFFVTGGLAGAIEESANPTSAWDMFVAFLGLAALTWDVVSIIWLIRHRASLPLHPQT
jgi:hypothetical protein